MPGPQTQHEGTAHQQWIRKQSLVRRRGQCSQNLGTAVTGLKMIFRRRVTRSLLSAATERLSEFKEGCFTRMHRRFVLDYNLLLFRTVHILITIIIWQHFFLTKFKQKEKGVPEGAPNYWLKRLVPPIEFGMMHQILFQMAILPLTMCRRTLAAASTGGLSRIIPFEHMVTFHIFVGYAFCLIIIAATVVFFGFFGKVCSDYHKGLDKANLCEKFSSEIFLTGLLGTLVPTVIVLISSFFRSRIKYEIFYSLHFLVFVMFLMAIIHTFDDEVRNHGKIRSQAINWFITSLALYFTDRAWSLMTRAKNVTVISVQPTPDRTCVILRLAKPPHFNFVPGQFVQICIPCIDAFYHPFSIGSAPSSDGLALYIEVQKGDSWTSNLASDAIIAKLKGGADVRIMGPYGYPVVDMTMANEVIAVGTGTGIVPMFSLIEQRLRRIMLIGKDGLGEARTAAFRPQAIHVDVEGDERYSKVDPARQQRLSDLVQFVPPAVVASISLMQLKYRLRKLTSEGAKSVYFKHLDRMAAKHKIHQYFDVFGALLVVLEVSMLGAMLSWTTIDPIAHMEFQGHIIKYTLLGQISLYAVHLCYRACYADLFPSSIFLACDFTMTCLMIALQTHWMAADNYESFQTPPAGDVVLRTALALYRMVRLMSANPVLRNGQVSKNAVGSINVLGTDKVQLIWVCRSANLVKGYSPILHALISKAHQNIYGELPEGDAAMRLSPFVDFTIYCTDKDTAMVSELKQAIAGTVCEGKVIFARPDLTETMLGITADSIKNITMSSGNSTPPARVHAVTFCGSKAVSQKLHHAIVEVNKLSTVVGFPQLHTIYREECYGHSAAPSKHEKPAEKPAKPPKIVFSSVR